MDGRQSNGSNRERVAQSFTLTDDKGRVKTRTLPSGEVIEYAYNGEDKKKVGILSGIYLKGLWDKPIVTGMNQDRDTSLVQQFNFGNGIANTLQKDKNGRIVLAGNPKVGQTMLNYDPNQKQLEPVNVKQTYSAQVGDTIHPQSGMSKQVRQVLDQVVYNRNPEPLFVQQKDVIEQISQTPEMDQWGRTVRQGDQHYQYDSQNRLIKITSTDETGQLIPIADYRYNTFNQRVAKTTYNHQGNQTKTTYYFYDGNQLIAETTDTAGQQADNLKQYVWLNDTPIAILQQGELYYIHTDHRNAPIAVTDSISKLVWQADNEDFGYASIHAKSTFELNLRLSNQYYDSESGLHYNTNRYYDALNQQYLTPDPLGLAAGPDLFAFALNQPHSISDPDGLAPIDYNSFADKLYYATAIGIKGFPASMAQFGKELWKLVSNRTTLTVVGTAFAAWGALHFVGVGQVVDALLVSTLAAAVGPLQVIAAVQFVWAFSKFISKTYTATCYADLESAGKILSDGMRNALVGFGSATVINKAIPFIKNFGKNINAAKALYKDSTAASYIKKATQRLAKTRVPFLGSRLTALNAFVDSSGRVVPKFSASSKYSWQEPPGAGVVTKRDWNYAKEANQVKAMEKFIKDNEKPVATWTPQVSNGNGFDYAYVRPNGQLVIVEAKSNNGYHTALTAFGGGKKPATVDINEQRLRDAINANRSGLNNSQYRSVMEKIENRDYEIELYVSSRTKLSSSKIGVTNNTMGMSMKRIIELPEILP
ncbi:RHS repeat-associated core domain-containing protein [Psychrobacter sp. APC 3279]|uniref:RHS repeat domain-containing protein n=1 Tax=Psychrobacter sp. APC 3279 TaxID=3035189 RepID=UPI0025B34212|nr:RHS repeat-associated core domain-containing protein [Psychrobacter sp. APC 3279]MDN3442645.1 RHS repeat-associated core domain-containing protein [Psychrobacter sp. APC 3279]